MAYVSSIHFATDITRHYRLGDWMILNINDLHK